MTKEDVIAMAREAKATQIGHEPPAFHFYLEDLERFAAIVASAEREACAKVCESIAKDMTDLAQWGATQCANSIRKRVQE